MLLRYTLTTTTTGNWNFSCAMKVYSGCLREPRSQKCWWVGSDKGIEVFRIDVIEWEPALPSLTLAFMFAVDRLLIDCTWPSLATLYILISGVTSQRLHLFVVRCLGTVNCTRASRPALVRLAIGASVSKPCLYFVTHPCPIFTSSLPCRNRIEAATLVITRA